MKSDLLTQAEYELDRKAERLWRKIMLIDIVGAILFVLFFVGLQILFAPDAHADCGTYTYTKGKCIACQEEAEAVLAAIRERAKHDNAGD